MNLKTKFGLMTMCSVCCALLHGEIFARDNGQQNPRQLSVSRSIKDFKETMQKSADQSRKRNELTPQWFEAAEKGDIEMMKSMYEDLFSGNNISMKDDDGRTALEIAVQNGHSDIVNWLLRCIHADKIPFNINSLTAKHNSLLAIATENGHKAVVRILLENRADPNAFNLSAEGRGRTALMIAAYKGYTDIVELLLNSNDDPKLYRRADTNEQDYGGKTALMIAVEQNHSDIVKLLLNYGANIKIKIKDKNGKRALDYAEGNAELTELLMEFSGNKEKKGGKNVFKKVWNKVSGKSDNKKSDLKNRRLSTDSTATLYDNDIGETNGLKRSASTDSISTLYDNDIDETNSLKRSASAKPNPSTTMKY